MKTAMQELIKLIKESEMYPSEDSCKCINYATELLAKEKRQLQDTFNESRLTHPMIGLKHETFEDYYNQTFTQ